MQSAVFPRKEQPHAGGGKPGAEPPRAGALHAHIMHAHIMHACITCVGACGTCMHNPKLEHAWDNATHAHPSPKDLHTRRQAGRQAAARSYFALHIPQPCGIVGNMCGAAIIIITGLTSLRTYPRCRAGNTNACNHGASPASPRLHGAAAAWRCMALPLMQYVHAYFLSHLAHARTFHRSSLPKARRQRSCWGLHAKSRLLREGGKYGVGIQHARQRPSAHVGGENQARKIDGHLRMWSI